MDCYLTEKQILQARTEFVKGELGKLEQPNCRENLTEIRAIFIAIDSNMNEIRKLKAKMMASELSYYLSVQINIETFEKNMLELQTRIEEQRALKLGTAQMK